MDRFCLRRRYSYDRRGFVQEEKLRRLYGPTIDLNSVAGGITTRFVFRRVRRAYKRYAQLSSYPSNLFIGLPAFNLPVALIVVVASGFQCLLVYFVVDRLVLFARQVQLRRRLVHPASDRQPAYKPYARTSTLP